MTHTREAENLVGAKQFKAVCRTRRLSRREVKALRQLLHAWIVYGAVKFQGLKENTCRVIFKDFAKDVAIKVCTAFGDVEKIMFEAGL